MRTYAAGKLTLFVQEGIALLRFNNPDKHNAMSRDMWEGLAEALEVAAADSEVRVLVLRGAGEKAFVSGSDLSESKPRPDAADEAASHQSDWKARLAAFPRPTVAAIGGYCIGGGMTIALETDIRIASASSKFGIPAAKLGLGYPYDGLRSLVHVVGAPWARLLMYTAMRIDAAQAERIGLVTQVVPDGQLDEHVSALARSIARNAPLSLEASKAAIRAVLQAPAERDMATVEDLVRRCSSSTDLIEGRQAFLDKRAPRFSGY